MASKHSLDYSRFNAIGSDDDDLEDAPLPHVTRFERPTSVTIGGPARSAASAPAAAATRHPQPDTTANGMDAGAFRWSQSATEAVVRVPLPASAKAKQVRVSLDKARLAVLFNGEAIVQGELANAVWGDGGVQLAGEDEREEKALDWELEDLGTGRCVAVRLTKRAPRGVTAWWQRVFKRGDEPVLDRPVGNQASIAKTRDAWAEAQRAFLEQRAQEKRAAE